MSLRRTLITALCIGDAIALLRRCSRCCRRPVLEPRLSTGKRQAGTTVREMKKKAYRRPAIGHGRKLKRSKVVPASFQLLHLTISYHGNFRGCAQQVAARSHRSFIALHICVLCSLPRLVVPALVCRPPIHLDHNMMRRDFLSDFVPPVVCAELLVYSPPPRHGLNYVRNRRVNRCVCPHRYGIISIFPLGPPGALLIPHRSPIPARCGRSPSPHITIR